MPPPAIRIRVGASLDANTPSVFKPIVQAARDARMAVEDEMARMHAAINGKSSPGAGARRGGPFRSLPDEAQRAADRVVGIEQKKQERIAREEQRAEDRRRRRAEAAERYVGRIRERYDRDQERATSGSRRENVGRLKSIVGGTGENLKAAGRGVLGIAGSVARGAGVQLDLGSYVGQAVSLETRASELSAAAYDPEKGGPRIDPKRLVGLGREIGNFAAFDPEKVLEGLQAFVAKTGDLATGESALPGLAKLARATGTSLEDMVGAAGEAAKALGDVGPGKEFETAAEKGKALVNVLRMIAGQGKVGAVELKDLASKGGRLAAASLGFGGDASRNLGDMGALAQLAVQRGGAASASEAATSVAGFANTLKTPARVKEFQAAGVEVYDKDKNFRSVRDILKDSASAAGGDPLAFKKMFGNVKGGQAADPANNAYRDAFNKELERTKDKKKADEAGRRAIDEMFDRFARPIGADEENVSFDRSMQTSAAKIQIFNNKLSEIGAHVAASLLPKLERLAPAVLAGANALATLVDFAGSNPGLAVTAAITGSIAKAAIGNVISTQLNKLLESMGKGMTGNMALGFGAVTFAIAAATLVVSALNERKQGAEGVKTGMAETQEALDSASAQLKAGKQVDPETRAALEAAKERIAKEREVLKAYEEKGGDGRYFGSKEGGVLSRIRGGFNQVSDVVTGETSFADIGRAGQITDDRSLFEMQASTLTAIQRQLEAQSKSTQKVEITNLPPGMGPKASLAGTTE